MDNRLRIIGGVWRSRQLRFQAAPGLRPTPARVRETVFNWLQHDIGGSRCLDLYAGSGALGFEAASRGAARVVQVEHNPVACQALAANARLLDARQLSLRCQDVGAYLSGAAEPFGIVFIDPPFNLGLAAPCCRLLDSPGWLLPGAKIYLETEKDLPLADLPPRWRLLKNQCAGEVRYRLYANGQ